MEAAAVRVHAPAKRQIRTVVLAQDRMCLFLVHLEMHDRRLVEPLALDALEGIGRILHRAHRRPPGRSIAEHAPKTQPVMTRFPHVVHSREIALDFRSSRWIHAFAGAAGDRQPGGSRMLRHSSRLHRFTGGLLVSMAWSLSSVHGETLDASDKARLADRVKVEFLHAWNGYKTHAWGFDDLKPLSKSGANWYTESLLMTPVDAFSSMMIMQLSEQAKEAKSLILEKLSFDKAIEVQVFEVNIRLLGGLLSAYQLDGDARFLDLAIDLANRLLPAFDSPTGMPIGSSISRAVRRGIRRTIRPKSARSCSSGVRCPSTPRTPFTMRRRSKRCAPCSKSDRRSTWWEPSSMSNRVPGKTPNLISGQGSIPITSIY